MSRKRPRSVRALLKRSLRILERTLNAIRIRFERLLDQGNYAESIRLAVIACNAHGGEACELLAGLLLEREDYAHLRELALTVPDLTVRAGIFVQLAKRNALSEQDGGRIRQSLATHVACDDLDSTEVASAGGYLIDLATATRQRDYLEAARDVAVRLSRRGEHLDASSLYSMIGRETSEWNDFMAAQMAAAQIRDPESRASAYDTLTDSMCRVVRPDTLAAWIPFMAASIPRQDDKMLLLLRLSGLFPASSGYGQA